MELINSLRAYHK